MSRSQVSIIAANYNNSQFLESFLASIYAGSMLPEKIIIADDGSTDDSPARLKELEAKYSHLEVVYLAENQGVANARNAAIAQVDTKYLAIADVDDLFNPERVEQQVAYLSQNPAVDLLGSNCAYFKGENSQATDSQSNFPLSYLQIIQQFKEGRNGLLNGTVTGKTELFQKFHYDQSTVWAEDYDLFSRMILAGCQAAALPEALMKVRVHQDSQTTNLQLATIQKIFQLREKHFGIPYQDNDAQREYQHLLNYRRYLATANPSKYYYLAKAVLYAPEKLLKRFKNLSC